MTKVYLLWVVVISALSLAYVIYLFRRFRGEHQLSLGDHLGIAGSLAAVLIGVPALWIAVDSYKVAVDSYKASEQGGKEQLETLKKARQAIIDTGTVQKDLLDKSASALDSVVRSSQQQQEILNKSLQTSKTQLAILVEQKQREMERPDVGLLLLQPKALEAMVYNFSPSKIAQSVHYSVNFVMVERPEPDGSYPMWATKTEFIDYIRPRDGYAPSILQFYSRAGQPRPGEKLFGWATITCPDCASARVYWVYWKFGEQGYYLERSDGALPLGNMPKQSPETALQQFLKTPGITPIPTSYKNAQ